MLVVSVATLPVMLSILAFIASSSVRVALREFICVIIPVTPPATTVKRPVCDVAPMLDVYETVQFQTPVGALDGRVRWKLSKPNAIWLVYST